MRIFLRSGKPHKSMFFATIILLSLTVLTSCASQKEEATVAFWVVAGTNRGDSFSNNSLGGYDAAGELVVKTSLPQYHISSLALDDQQHLWLGQAWNDTESSNELMLWQRDKLVDKIEVGMQPEAGIVQFSEQMVAGCTENGMGFSLWAVNPESLESSQIASVDREEKDFLFLTTIAASEDYLVAAAIHDAPGTSESHSSIWWFDGDYNLCGSLYLGQDSAIWSMVPIPDGNFLLINNSGFAGNNADLLVFDPRSGTVVKEISSSGFGFRGAAANGKYYILNRIWSSTRINSERSVTIIDGDLVRTIPLPDDLGAEDIAVEDGNIYLACWQQGDDANDGVYRLDPGTEELEHIIQHTNASSVLVAPQK